MSGKSTKAGIGEIEIGQAKIDKANRETARAAQNQEKARVRSDNRMSRTKKRSSTREREKLEKTLMPAKDLEGCTQNQSTCLRLKQKLLVRCNKCKKI